MHLYVLSSNEVEKSCSGLINELVDYLVSHERLEL